MLSAKLSILLFVIILFRYSKSNDIEVDYDDNSEFEDCEYVIDFKIYRKTPKLDLCDALKNPSLQSRIQLQIYSNYTEGKLHLHPILISSSNSNINKSLITLTTDIVENFKYSINGYKQILSCSGNFYPKQDIKILNITSAFTKPITCTKESQPDQFFTLREQIYLYQVNQNKFNLLDIHQDDQNKISRTTWYTCNNPKACNNGLQNKNIIDKTVNYVLKVLQKGPIEKKNASG